MVKYLAIAGGLLLSAAAYSQTDSAVFYQQKGNAEKQARRFKEAEKISSGLHSSIPKTYQC